MLLLWWAVCFSSVVVVHCVWPFTCWPFFFKRSEVKTPKTLVETQNIKLPTNLAEDFNPPTNILQTEDVKPATFSGYPHMVKPLLYNYIIGNKRCSVVMLSGTTALVPLKCLLKSPLSKVPPAYMFSILDYGTLENITLCSDGGSYDDQLAVLTFRGEFTGKPATLPAKDLDPQELEGLRWSLSGKQVVKAVPVTTNDSHQILYHLTDGEVNINEEDVGGPTLTGEDVLVGVHSPTGRCGTNQTPCKDIRVTPRVSNCIREHMTPSTYPMFRKLYKYVDQSWVPFCGMTMISPRTAVTAAACVVDVETNKTADKNLYRVFEGKISNFIINFENITHSWAYQVALVIFYQRYKGNMLASLPPAIAFNLTATRQLCQLTVYSGAGSGFRLRPLFEGIEFKDMAVGNRYGFNFTYENQVFINSDRGGPTLCINQSQCQLFGVHTFSSHINYKMAGEDIFVSNQVVWIHKNLV